MITILTTQFQLLDNFTLNCFINKTIVTSLNVFILMVSITNDDYPVNYCIINIINSNSSMLYDVHARPVAMSSPPPPCRGGGSEPSW